MPGARPCSVQGSQLTPRWLPGRGECWVLDLAPMPMLAHGSFPGPILSSGSPFPISLAALSPNGPLPFPTPLFWYVFKFC